MTFISGDHDECSYSHGLAEWGSNGDQEQHICHAHPLGLQDGESIITYWCGHTCAESLCRAYKWVWMLTHPRAVWRHHHRQFADGRSR